MALSVLSDEYFMQQALKEAELAYHDDEIPVGAVIVCNNTIIAKAHNLTERLNDITAHAEIQAIFTRVHYICNLRTMRYVRRGSFLVTNRKNCLRSKRS